MILDESFRGAPRPARSADLRNPSRVRVRQRRVDASNVPGEDTVAAPPGRSGRLRSLRLRARLHELTGAETAIVITDSFGRAWRHGQCDIAIGCAGIDPLEDWRGCTDALGRGLEATVDRRRRSSWRRAADLARTQGLARSRVIVTAAPGATSAQTDGPGAAALIRPQGARICSDSALSRRAGRRSRAPLRSSWSPVGDLAEDDRRPARTDPTGWMVNSSEVMRRRQAGQGDRDQQPAENLGGERERDQPAGARPPGDKVPHR